ncbi:MAG TPA: hypothetical protein VK737_07040, partial [Opitutales bacterium]|nr:hypothetical protein [Opitutales bacterium]
MKFHPTLSLLVSFALATTPALAQSPADTTTAIPAAPAGARLTLPLESAWLFHRTDLPNVDLTQWNTVSLPHDWAIAGPFSADAPSRRGGAYLPSGIG